MKIIVTWAVELEPTAVVGSGCGGGGVVPAPFNQPCKDGRDRQYVRAGAETQCEFCPFHLHSHELLRPRRAFAVTRRAVVVV